jgi:endo-alpha-1,4-polygalactosaminidase (GH114 family)
MKEEIIKTYIEMIDNLGYEAPFLDTVKNFIKTYDGSDTKEFHALMIETIALIVNAGGLQVKADAYDALEKADEKKQEEMEELVASFEGEEDEENIPIPL